MNIAEKMHEILLALFVMVFAMAIWGLTGQQDAQQLPVTIWAAIGGVSAVGALLELYMHLRTRQALKSIRAQLEKMSHHAEVGMVMIDDHWPVAGLANMINHYLSRIKTEIDEQARRQRELDVFVSAVVAEKNNTEAVIRSISDGVLVCNAFGEILLANWQIGQLFGFDPQETKGKMVTDVIEQSRICNLINQAQNGEKEPANTNLWIADRSGNDRCFDVTVRPVFIQDNDLWAVVVTMHDVTRQKQLAEMKNDFVNHVSHELRAPLTSIKAYIELLMDNELTDRSQRRDFYRIIHAESTRLEAFIDNILNFSRIESGVMPFDPKPTDFSESLNNLVELIRPQADEKGITLTAEIPDQLDINADAVLLRQATLNLLSNAVKYTPDAGHVALKASLDDNQNINITVKDTGIGISPQDQDRIFQKFYRTQSGDQIASGTGLGLALTKKIVEHLHQGTLNVESTPNEGSSFTITVPKSSDAIAVEEADATLATG